MRKGMTITAALLLALLPLRQAWGDPVDGQCAATVARNFLSQRLGTKAVPTITNRSSEWAYDGIYLFTAEGGGFVLVAADDAVRPILGYSTTGHIDPSDLPIQFADWMQAYQQEIDLLRQQGAQATKAHALQWQQLSDPYMAIDSAHARKSGLGPLCTTTWSQDAPFNDLCPGEGDNRAVVGCAATAQAIMMKYWNHPPIGKGTHSYVSEHYGPLTVDFGSTIYDWDYMVDNPTVDSSARVRQAVALLMYHCGVAQDMMYNTGANGGSGSRGLTGNSGVASIDNSLKNYFGYSPDLRVVKKGNAFTNKQWRDMLIEELDQLHPIVYTGTDQAGGHAFICDGYDSDSLMHFNFGWRGNSDGYYAIGDISPLHGGVGGNATYTFNMNNVALLGAVPVYGIGTGDSIMLLPQGGGTDSVLFSANSTVATPWTVDCDADWLTVGEATFTRAGWVGVSAGANNTGRDRVADLVFRHGNEQAEVKVVQSAYNDDERCPMTVELFTSGPASWGWRGEACLTIESAEGYILGKMHLEGKGRDTVTVLVDPKDVRAVWHRGGSSDRVAGYTVRNSYGETLLHVDNALDDEGEHLFVWPCGHAAAQGPQPSLHRLYPNPTTGRITIDDDDISEMTVMDTRGQIVLRAHGATADLSTLPAGIYAVRVVGTAGTTTHKVVKQ